MAEKKIFGHGHLGHQMQFLIDDRDSGCDGFTRRRKTAFAASNAQLAARRQMRAAEDFQQSRFARAILAQQSMDAALPYTQRNVRQRLNTRERLADGFEAEIVIWRIHGRPGGSQRLRTSQSSSRKTSASSRRRLRDL